MTIRVNNKNTELYKNSNENYQIDSVKGTIGKSCLREGGIIWIMMMMIAQTMFNALKSSTLYHHGNTHDN